MSTAKARREQARRHYARLRAKKDLPYNPRKDTPGLPIKFYPKAGLTESQKRIKQKIDRAIDSKKKKRDEPSQKPVKSIVDLVRKRS